MTRAFDGVYEAMKAERLAPRGALILMIMGVYAGRFILDFMGEVLDASEQKESKGVLMMVA